MNLDEKLVAQRAGSSIADYKFHNPSWIDEKVPDALLEEFCPCLMSEIRKIDVLWNHSGLSRKSENYLCLESAMGFLLPIKTTCSGLSKWPLLNIVTHIWMITMFIMNYRFVTNAIILRSAIICLEALCLWNLGTV